MLRLHLQSIVKEVYVSLYVVQEDSRAGGDPWCEKEDEKECDSSDSSDNSDDIDNGDDSNDGDDDSDDEGVKVGFCMMMLIYCKEIRCDHDHHH